MARGTARGTLSWALQSAQLIVRGVCFTYGTMFALESLAIAGENYQNSERVRKACHFLIGKMKDDGGWGETYMVS